MARSRRRHATRRPKRRQGVPGWAWLLAGVALGLGIAVAAYFQLRPGGEPPPPPPAARTTPQQPEAPKPVPPAPKPRFDFYTILPEMEVVVPEESITGKTEQGVRQVEKPGTYLLQVGSFRTLRQADQLKARLALLGFEPRIQKVTVDDGRTFHRVRVGPFHDLQALNQARARLREHHIKAMLLKVRE